jgi:hypothetical protein
VCCSRPRTESCASPSCSCSQHSPVIHHPWIRASCTAASAKPIASKRARIAATAIARSAVSAAARSAVARAQRFAASTRGSGRFRDAQSSPVHETAIERRLRQRGGAGRHERHVSEAAAASGRRAHHHACGRELTVLGEQCPQSFAVGLRGETTNVERACGCRAGRHALRLARPRRDAKGGERTAETKQRVGSNPRGPVNHSHRQRCARLLETRRLQSIA